MALGTGPVRERETSDSGGISAHDDPRSDSELLVQSRRDPEAFGLLYRRHSEDLLAYFYRRTRNPEVAADLLAETFAIAYTKRRRYRRTSSPGRAWLYGIARLEYARFCRRREVELRAVRKLGITVPAMSDEDITRIEAIVDAEMLSGPLVEAVADLSPAERQAVVARVVGEMDYGEIAESIGITRGAARVRVHRGLGRLAEAMVR